MYSVSRIKGGWLGTLPAWSAGRGSGNYGSCAQLRVHALQRCFCQYVEMESGDKEMFLSAYACQSIETWGFVTRRRLCNTAASNSWNKDAIKAKPPLSEVGFFDELLVCWKCSGTRNYTDGLVPFCCFLL